MFLEYNKFLADGSSGGSDMLLLSSRGPCNHNFIISHLLVNASRSGKKVRLVCLGESRQFYSLVCQRAGVSLQSLEASKKITTLCAVSMWKAQVSSGVEPSLPSEVTESEGDEDLIIVDDILPLLDLFEVNEVLKVICDLKTSTRGMLVVGVRTEAKEIEAVMKLLKVMCSMWTEVYPLTTGYSKDVHGVLEMWAFKPHLDGSLHRKMHYKVTERGAKLLIIGSHTLGVL